MTDVDKQYSSTCRPVAPKCWLDDDGLGNITKLYRFVGFEDLYVPAFCIVPSTDNFPRYLTSPRRLRTGYGLFVVICIGSYRPLADDFAKTRSSLGDRSFSLLDRHWNSLTINLRIRDDFMKKNSVEQSVPETKMAARHRPLSHSHLVTSHHASDVRVCVPVAESIDSHAANCLGWLHQWLALCGATMTTAEWNINTVSLRDGVALSVYVSHYQRSKVATLTCLSFCCPTDCGNVVPVVLQDHTRHESALTRHQRRRQTRSS